MRSGVITQSKASEVKDTSEARKTEEEREMYNGRIGKKERKDPYRS